MSSLFYGVCLFDDKKMPADGWACKPGGNPERITGLHDLPNDINWVTNLEYAAFQQHNLGHMKHLCQSQYFRESVDSLAKDYGFGDGTNAKASKFLAEHFNNTATFGHTILGIDPLRVRNNYRYAQMISSQLDVPILRQQARGLPQEISQLICTHATQVNQAMIGSVPNQEAVHCYFPRLLYFRWLLNQMVPISMDWALGKTFEGDKGIVGYNSGIMKGERFLTNIAERSKADRRVYFFRISVLKQQKDLAIFGTFGRGKPDAREWVTLPELLCLARYSLVQIKEFHTLPGGYLRDQLDFLTDLEKLPDTSISMGLFMQNVAAALMQQINKKDTALGAYLRAYDRVACMHAAEQLYLKEVIPASFSMGRIVVKAPAANKLKVQACMASLGLIPFAEGA